MYGRHLRRSRIEVEEIARIIKEVERVNKKVVRRT